MKLVGIALLCRGQTAPRWSASEPQVTRRKPDGAVEKKDLDCSESMKI